MMSKESETVRKPVFSQKCKQQVPAFSRQESIYHIGMCVTDLCTRRDSDDIMRKRMALYKELGLKTVRTTIAWSTMEPEEGQWQAPPEEWYLQHIADSGLRIKLILAAVSCIPRWYLEKYPEAVLINDAGEKAISSVTYLMPGLRPLLDNAVEHMLQYLADSGFLSAIDSIVVDMGPAGEPLYPPAWTQNPNWLTTPSGPEHFWCYDPLMQADYRRTMEEKYGTIAAANAAWGTAYPSFEELAVPKPNTVKGTMWNDLLTWYRDVKRDFVDANAASHKRLIERYTNGRVTPILYIPGSDVRDEEWRRCVEEGDGTVMVKLMADSRFIIDTAVKYGCYLQYTGAENVPEIIYLKRYMEDIGAGSIPLFGENAGGYDIGKNMDTYVDALIEHHLQGVDITHDQWIHAPDHFSPNEHYALIKDSLARLAAYLLA